MRLARRVAAVLLASVLALTVTSCAGATRSAPSLDPNKKVRVTVWAWDSTIERAAQRFNKANPNVSVTVTNADTTTDQYQALNRALQTGKGVPDAAQIEYYALPEFASRDAVKDLSDYGAKGYKDFYTPGTWNSVNLDNKVYALPLDSGPMALFYNKEVFDAAGVDRAPATWEEYYQAARKIRAIGKYITSDAGDPGFFDSMVWQAGGQPFSTHRKKVAINLTDDAGTQRWTAYWQRMIDEDLIDTRTVEWSNDWDRGLSDGTIASVLAGGWLPHSLLSDVPQGAGRFRVAQTPTWESGGTQNSENGGSTLSIMRTTSDEKAAAAYKFMDYATHDSEGIRGRVLDGAFPADNDTLGSAEFLDQTTLTTPDGGVSEYFGGQKFNQVLSQAARNVLPNHQFLPYEIHARSAFGSTAGAAFRRETTLVNGVRSWQDELIAYAKQQGYQVS